MAFTWFAYIKYIDIFQIFVEKNDFAGAEFITVITIITLIFLILYLYKSLKSVLNFTSIFRFKPSFIIAFSFGAVILAGTIVLFLPVSRNPTSEPISLLNALFTATSAVCVTGLTVVDTGSYFSRFGQVVILILAQIGALGIMTFAAFFTFIIGEKMSFFGKYSTQNVSSEIHVSKAGRFIFSIILTTFIIELAGAAFLFVKFYSQLPLAKAVYYSLFHAISAFSNAGFALYPDSLMGFRSDVLINATIMSLIVLGGLGFSVTLNLRRRITGKDKKLNLHTKIVIFTTLFLIVFGTVIFYIMERNNSLAGSGSGDSFLTSLFASITARTAGFNTIDFGEVRESTLFFMSLLMFIGASPGSTGGGIKTTTMLIIILTIFNTLRENPVVRIFGREIPIEIIRKSLTIFFLSFFWVLIETAIIASIEPFSFSQVFFESISAFGTVGLSTGITPRLSPVSRALLVLSMFIGRVGPLTLMFSLGIDKTKALVRRPEEKILIG